MGSYILTFDIGTSACKAVLFDQNLTWAASGRGSYPVHILDDERVEQRPDEILKGVRDALRNLVDCGVDLGEVQAVSFSSQASAQCLVGIDDKPLTNILSWMDKRAAREAEEFLASFSKEEIIRLTGLDMVVTPAYSIAKLRWLNKNCPEITSQAKHFVQPKEVVIHELTGKWVSDATSLKGLVDQKTGEPVTEIMEFIGVSAELIPEVKAPYDIAGLLLPDVPGMEGLRPGIPVIVGWNDMNAAFLGMAGFPEKCVGLDMTGTSEHFGVVCPFPPEEDIYEGLNKVPFINKSDVYYGVTSTGGQAAEWFSREVLSYSSAQECFAQVGAYEEFPIEEVENLIFLPYIEGERNPWNDARIRGSWIGLSRVHGQKHMAWSVMEGVCFALKAMYERFPIKPERFLISGGAGRNDVWTQMKADVLGVPFERGGQNEAGCTGAAILALRALKPEWSFEKLNGCLSKEKKVFWPNERLYEYYEKKYSRFIRLYHDLKKYF